MLNELADSDSNLDTNNCSAVESKCVFSSDGNSESGLVSTKESLFNIIHMLDPVPRKDRLCFSNTDDKLVTVLNEPCMCL
jgi:hypothetical protein